MQEMGQDQRAETLVQFSPEDPEEGLEVHSKRSHKPERGLPTHGICRHLDFKAFQPPEEGGLSFCCL